MLEEQLFFRSISQILSPSGHAAAKIIFQNQIFSRRTLRHNSWGCVLWGDVLPLASTELSPLLSPRALASLSLLRSQLELKGSTTNFNFCLVNQENQHPHLPLLGVTTGSAPLCRLFGGENPKELQEPTAHLTSRANPLPKRAPSINANYHPVLMLNKTQEQQPELSPTCSPCELQPNTQNAAVVQSSLTCSQSLPQLCCTINTQGFGHCTHQDFVQQQLCCVGVTGQAVKKALSAFKKKIKNPTKAAWVWQKKPCPARCSFPGWQRRARCLPWTAQAG